MVKIQFSDKVLFMSLDWSSDKGKEAAAAYGIEKAPAAILVDKNGNVVAKTEGALSAPDMEQALKDLTRKSGG